jgi:hypothetical protein
MFDRNGVRADSGFGAMDRMMDRVNYIKALVAAGIPVRDIMSAEKKTAERACERLAQGASKEEVIQVLGA